MQDIILFGMQGSGKGTQGKLLVQKYGYKMFETGAELRKIRESGTELGEKIKSIMDAGHLVNTPVVMEVIENFLKNTDSEEKILFDGIPRSMEQFLVFEKLMSKFGRDPNGINIALTRDEALKRLSKRFICVGVDMTNNPLMTEEECIRLGGTVKKRDDDNEESIIRRIDTFFNETQPVIEEYKKQSRMFEINGIQSVENVTNDIILLLSK